MMFIEKYLDKYLKNRPDRKNKYLKTFKTLQVNPNYPSLKLHKIDVQKANNLYAVSLNKKDRLLFFFNEENNIITLVNIGTHKVYSKATSLKKLTLI